MNKELNLKSSFILRRLPEKKGSTGQSGSNEKVLVF